MQIAARHAGHAPGTQMKSGQSGKEDSIGDGAPGERLEAPLIWTFAGPFATCLADMEDTFRRAIIQVGDVSRIAVQDRSVAAGAEEARPTRENRSSPQGNNSSTPDAALRPARRPRVRHVKTGGPLATMVIAYRR